MEAVTHNQLPEASFYLKALLEGFAMHYLPTSIASLSIQTKIEAAFKNSNYKKNPKYVAQAQDKSAFQNCIKQVPDQPNSIGHSKTGILEIRGSSISKLVSSETPKHTPTPNNPNWHSITLPCSIVIQTNESAHTHNDWQDLYNKLHIDELKLQAQTADKWFRYDHLHKSFVFWIKKGTPQAFNFLSISGNEKQVTRVAKHAEKIGEIDPIDPFINLEQIEESMNAYLRDANNTFKHDNFSLITGSAKYQDVWDNCRGLAGMYVCHVVPLLKHIHETSKSR